MNDSYRGRRPMDQNLRSSGKTLVAPIIFLLGLGVASVLDWPRGSEASAPVQTPPPSNARIQEARELGEAFIAIADAVTPGVVRIQSIRAGGDRATVPLPPGYRDFFDGSPGGEGRPRIAGGTGFIVSNDGYILTNNHVVAGADRIIVSLVDKRTFDAVVVGRDPTTDVAVIRIDARGLPAMRLGDSERARVGEWVLAIGNPGFGDTRPLDFTVTSGIISAKGRPLEIINRELFASGDPSANYAIEDFIQTDAVINPGNSGGPLVNLQGEVIGINTAIASGTGFFQGYGFAIPINLARRVMDDLIEHGHVRRALLGINITDVTPEDAEVFGLPEIAGVLIEDFAKDSPAERAGLDRGDVIVEVGGEKVERVGQLQRLIAQHRPGESVAVRVIRYGQPHRFRIRLTEAPISGDVGRGPVPMPREREDLGIEVSELTPSLAREIGYSAPGGAIITGVVPASPAAQRDIRGYRIVAIDRRPVESAREAQAILRGARSGQVISLLLEGPDGRTRIANLRVP